MSHTSNGTIFKTPSGKYVRTYMAQTHGGPREYVQETPDITCATVVRGGMHRRSVAVQAEREFGELTELEVEVVRTVKVLSDPEPVRN